jgi:polyhydroxyalkanoate synthesis regulator protein
MAQAFGGVGFGPLEDVARRNMEMFERTFAMFAPFARREGQPGATTGSEPETPPRGAGDIDNLKKQMEEMQKRLDRLSDKDKP